MLSLQEKLKQVPWENLHHAYGPARDTLTWLFALLSDQAEQREQALNNLWASICHQGSVYEGSCAAVPFLIEILAEVPDQRKPDILALLYGLAHVSWYANKEQRFLRIRNARRRAQSGYQWHSWGEFLQVGNEYHDPRWMQQAHRLVAEGIPLYLTLLQSPEKDVMRETLDLLSGFQEHNTLLIPAIAPLAFGETETSIQVAALHSLGALLEQDSPYWQDYQRLAHTSAASPDVTFAAAYTLGWHHPSGASPATVDVLLASVLPPQPCDELKDVCKVLSHLGMSLGFQGLIDALNRGADHWSILDTIRVVEALLDVAFFGGWVQDRFWSRTIKKHLSSHLPIPSKEEEIADAEEDLFDLDDEEEACFKWDYSMGFTFGDGAISCFGHDEEAAQTFQHCFEQEGPRALTDPQRLALEVLLHCEPLWQRTHNLLTVYGLPTARHELEKFLKGN
jgi:hypothetical protein